MRTITALILCVLTHVALAADGGLPLERASKAYLAKGSDSFIPSLVKGSPLENDRGALSQSTILKKLEPHSGMYQDYELIYEKTITSKIRLVYFALNFEKTAMFGEIMYYKRGGEEVVTRLSLKTELFEILPKESVIQLRGAAGHGGPSP